jgi:hypothetical protein
VAAVVEDGDLVSLMLQDAIDLFECGVGLEHESTVTLARERLEDLLEPSDLLTQFGEVASGVSESQKDDMLSRH